MLWAHQKRLAEEAVKILRERHIVYLAMEMRVGKTLIALEACRLLRFQRVLFITKKKAIQSIQKDYIAGGFTFELRVVNFEQVHKVKDTFDAIIIDEAHCLGAFPRPSLRAKRLRTITQDAYILFLSGTPTPESFSQIFHQFWVTKYSPFPHRNFYRWADEYVSKYQIILHGVQITKYDRAKAEQVLAVVEPYFIRYTRRDAEFHIIEAEEHVIYVTMRPETYRLAKTLLQQRLVRFPDGEIVLGDNPGKLLWKLHQIYSGTVICESEERKILDDTKARYIQHHFSQKKICIYYKYKSEASLLKRVFPQASEDSYSQNPILLLQISAGSMGLDLSHYDAIVFFNIDFSATNYWQARSRLFHKDRTSIPKIYWIFAEGGIEARIYRMVQKKKDYTVRYFVREYVEDSVSVV